MFLCVQALCFLHLLHKSFAALLLGFLSHIPLMDFSFAFTCNMWGVTGGGGSGNRPFHPTKDNTAPTMSRSITILLLEFGFSHADSTINIHRLPFNFFALTIRQPYPCALWWVGVEGMLTLR